MTVDMRAEVLNFKPVAVVAGTFDAHEIRYQCNTRGPFGQTSCGSWTRWYAPQVGNIIANKEYSTRSSWELTAFKRIPAQWLDIRFDDANIGIKLRSILLI